MGDSQRAAAAAFADDDGFSVVWERLALNCELGAVTDLLQHARAALRLKDLLIHDSLDGTLTQLEAFGDEFERLARTPEQAALAADFQKLVASLGKTVFPAIEHRLREKDRSMPQSRDSRAVIEIGR
jgi:hypothetical protein